MAQYLLPRRFCIQVAVVGLFLWYTSTRVSLRHLKECLLRRTSVPFLTAVRLLTMEQMGLLEDGAQAEDRRRYWSELRERWRRLRMRKIARRILSRLVRQSLHIYPSHRLVLSRQHQSVTETSIVDSDKRPHGSQETSILVVPSIMTCSVCGTRAFTAATASRAVTLRMDSTRGRPTEEEERTCEFRWPYCGSFQQLVRRHSDPCLQGR